MPRYKKRQSSILVHPLLVPHNQTASLLAFTAQFKTHFLPYLKNKGGEGEGGREGGEGPDLWILLSL